MHQVCPGSLHSARVAALFFPAPGKMKKIGSPGPIVVVGAAARVCRDGEKNGKGNRTLQQRRVTKALMGGSGPAGYRVPHEVPWMLRG